MSEIKEKYNDVFLVERRGKITMFFLLKRKTPMDMEEFMNTHKISKKTLKEHPNEIMDFYNDMIKFQNKHEVYLNHLTIFTHFENEILKYLTDKEKDIDFVKWVTINDKEWIEKIQKYFLTKEFFEKSDNNTKYSR